MPKQEPPISRSAFERFVREHHAAVYQSCLRILRDPALALDVTQDVYLALLAGRIVLTGAGDERVLRWFAVRSSLGVMRAQESRRAREKGYAMQHSDDRRDDSAEVRDEARALEHCVAQLPEDLRLAVQLRYHEDMTYEAVGGALSISGPSAHERVKRALTMLRESLSRAGFAGLSTGLEDHLARSAHAPAPLAPAHVAPQLVALHSGAAAATSVAGVVWFFVTLVVVTAVAVPWLASRHTDELGTARVDAGQPGAAASRRDDPSIEAPGLAATASGGTRTMAPLDTLVSPAPAGEEPGLSTGTIVGLLVDDQGVPFEGAVVIAESVERQGKIARHAGRGRSGRDGRFTIPVPIGPAGDTNYTLVLEGRAELEHRGKDDFVRASRDLRVDAGTLHLRPAPRDEPGDFTLEARIVDQRGAPVPQATVALFREVRSPDGWSPRSFEAGGRSDDLGFVRLAGAHVGPKRLVVDARDQGFRRALRALELGAGAHQETVVLEPGLEIAGRLVDVDGHAVTPDPEHRAGGYDIQLHAAAVGEQGDWRFATFDASGGFVVRGLDPVEYELGISGGPWSAVCLSGVRAGTRDLVLTLKLDDDPRAHGDHCAEIHGRLFDAETKAAVPVDLEAAEVVTLPAGITRAEFDRDIAPSLLWERPVQRVQTGDYYPTPSERVRATGLSGGTYAFVVRAPGYAPALVAPIVLAPHEVRADLTLALVRPTSITGRVLDLDGRPCANAFVCLGGSGSDSLAHRAATDLEVVNTDGHPAAWRQDLVRTDADGHFRFDGLAPDLVYAFSALHVQRDSVTSGAVSGRTRDEVELRFVRTR